MSTIGDKWPLLVQGPAMSEKVPLILWWLIRENISLCCWISTLSLGKLICMSCTERQFLPSKSLRRLQENEWLSSGMVHPFKGESSGDLFCINILNCMLCFINVDLCSSLIVVINLVHARWVGLLLTMILHYCNFYYFLDGNKKTVSFLMQRQSLFSLYTHFN